MTDKNPSSSRIALALRSFGRDTAQIVLAVGTYGFVLAVLFLGADVSVQRVPFGIAALCICTGGITHALCVLFSKFPWLLPSNIRVAFIEKSHKLLIAFAIVVPLAVSWSSNETLYGALNPIGYWRDQASKVSNSGCEFTASLLPESAERYQVETKKYKMGIATSTELKEAAESLMLLSDIHNKCVKKEQARASKVAARLKELEQGVR